MRSRPAEQSYEGAVSSGQPFLPGMQQLKQQVTKLTWRRPHRMRGGKSVTRSYISRVPKSLHPKQDLDPFSRVCIAKPRDRRPRYENIDHYSPHLMYCMFPNKIAFKSKAYHPRACYFCSCDLDLDLDLLTLIYERKAYIWKIYLPTQRYLLL